MDSKKLLKNIKRSRLNKTSSFIVLYKNGYYADKQPHYEWSFTDKISFSKKYKTFNTAMRRAMYIVKSYPLISIQEVQSVTDVKDGYSNTEEKIVKTWDKKTAIDIYRTNRLKKLSKKYKVNTDPLTVTVIKSSAEHDFWN